MSKHLRAASPSSFPRRTRLALAVTAGAAALVACGGNDDSPPPTYALGGTVSGLSAAGLVLANGTMTAAVAAGASSFQFPGGLATGTAYAVAVQTQPAGETCAVANGSATVGTADVTNVQVACAANAYSVGGSITGLNADGLVLANGSDTVQPASGASSFTLAQRVATGSTYSVAVTHQPAGETCTVSGSFPATMGAGDVTGIAVTCTTTSNPVATGTFAGNQQNCTASDGTGGAAGFGGLFGNGVFDAAGNLYVADASHTIRKVTPQGVVSTLAGQSGSAGFVDGQGPSARFNFPVGLAIDAAGNLYVADQGNNAIRMVTPAGVVTTLAGSGAQGRGDGPGASATLSQPVGVAVDATGRVYFTEGAYWIRSIAPTSTHDVSLYAGSYGGPAGMADGTVGTASFNRLFGLAFDASGNLDVADGSNQNVRRISPQGNVTTLAGPNTTIAFGLVDATGAAARFNAPGFVAADASGNLFVSDTGNMAVRKVTAQGVVTTVFNGSAFGDRNPEVRGIEVDAQGNLYIERSCSVYRVVAP
ncbi:MAG TPA: hypothetical protein VMU47_09030 [Caldimonas sp.]|nr:hypothetical protein [Caldimonas sp.]